MPRYETYTQAFGTGDRHPGTPTFLRKAAECCVPRSQNWRNEMGKKPADRGGQKTAPLGAAAPPASVAAPLRLSSSTFRVRAHGTKDASGGDRTRGSAIRRAVLARDDGGRTCRIRETGRAGCEPRASSIKPLLRLCVPSARESR